MLWNVLPSLYSDNFRSSLTLQFLDSIMVKPTPLLLLLAGELPLKCFFAFDHFNMISSTFRSESCLHGANSGKAFMIVFVNICSSTELI